MANSKELVIQAMARQHPESIPVMCQLANGHTVMHTATHPIDYFMSSEVWADCFMRIRELYDFDGILCQKPGRVHGLGEMVARTDYDAEIPTIHLHDGSRIECTRNDDAYYKPADGFAFPTIDEIDCEHPLDWAPDSYKAFMVSKATFDYRTAEEIPGHVFATLDRLVGRVGKEFSIHGEVRAPFDHFLSLLGMNAGLMAMLDNPEKCHQLLETATQWSVALAKALVRHGADAVKLSNPYAGMGFISREMYEEFLIPTETRVAEAIKAEGAYVYTHTCGAIGDRLDLLVKSGTSGLECLDPPPLGNVELSEAVEALKERIFIKGNVDPVNTLFRGSRDKITADVTKILETAGHEMPGFILSSACSIAPPTDPENIKLMVDLCRKFKP